MIGWLKDKTPEHRRHLFARIVLWGSMALCVAIGGHLLYRLHHLEKVDVVFHDYFSARDRISRLKEDAADSLHRMTRLHAGAGTLDGWMATAAWLEKMQRQGEDQGLAVTYRIDTLGVIPGGNQSIQSVPVHFTIVPDNRFDAVLDFMRTLCCDTAIIVRFEKAELVGGAKGLTDVKIDLTTWIRL